MRRAVIALVAGAFVLIPSLPVLAHPAPTDAAGGHVCRPQGAGTADCAQFGLVVGEYHCETDPCREALQKVANGWCLFGLPVPTRSDLTGIHFAGELTPPIRVIRRAGPGHVLEVHRFLFPALVAPQACLAPNPGVELHLPTAAASAHRAAPDRGAARVVDGAAAATTTAALGNFAILSAPPAAPDPVAVPAMTAAAWAALRGGRRSLRSLRRYFWQSHR